MGRLSVPNRGFWAGRMTDLEKGQLSSPVIYGSHSVLPEIVYVQTVVMSIQL
jgi:hypothetical protein